MSRRETINQAFELVLHRMSLRPPQAAALEKLRDLLIRLPKPLCECTDQEVREFMTFDGYVHTQHPSFVLSLATGVGKTRLAGAIMAMLWLSGEAQNFLFLAPSKAVLNRLRSAFNPAFREYIFIEQNLVPEPTLIVTDQLEDPVATGRQQSLFSDGPTIYLLTHQLITTSARFRKSSNEFSGESPADYLRNKPDLVVISDEAHHIDESADEQAAWPRAIADLNPRIHLGLTATPPRDSQGQLRSWVNLLHQYTLQEALNQELYTKRVEMLVHHFSDEVDAEEIDRATIRYAIQCLSTKAEAAAGISGPHPFPGVKPVAVFFAQDTAHATQVAEQLRVEFGVPDAEILLTHSKKSKTIEQSELLSSIEDENNPIRYVVNVQELVEGWDVTNVYVIAPLRAMASFAFGVQAMGRGLRLPAGKRTGNSLVDTLDLICFGRVTLEEIIEKETKWTGRATDGKPLIEAKQWDDPKTSPVSVLSETQKAKTLTINDLELINHELNLSLGPAAFANIHKIIVSKLRLAAAQMRVSNAEGRLLLSREVFIGAVASEVIRRMPRQLSDEMHTEAVKGEIERWLKEGSSDSDVVQFNPIQVASAMVDALKSSVEREVSDYTPTGKNSIISFPEFQITFEVQNPIDGSSPVAPAAKDLPVITDRSAFKKGRPYRGWGQALHTLYSFDSWQEAKTAQLLDRAEVNWWVRNQPRRFRIETSAGWFNPDFIVATIGSDGADHILLLEVKGDDFWSPPDGKARLKAAAANQWIIKQNECSGTRWSFGVALESVVESVTTWDELKLRLLEK